MIRLFRLFRLSEETHAARVELREALRNLAEVSAQSTEETDDYLKANGRVIRAERRLPWWQRFDIEMTA
ncbi:hypothetical protein GCM10010169_23510 [Micromonospora fulviviridis]|uniref:hypothetical protein n=1 Tax=Micromonospora fulviviridis TaxID=47860 RepID=UPI0016692412|nr:hypothetical protein [Micromonospora fulviviridis]GGR78626.1 hypothetical protein GCM10010169_23510 [Micromonospora fulviviridis]